MIFENLGNLSALRTFRVLRALKTVAVIPGETLKCTQSFGDVAYVSGEIGCNNGAVSIVRTLGFPQHRKV